MGLSKLFRCCHCGYEVQCGGSISCGFVAAVATVSCLWCRELSDLYLGKVVESPWIKIIDEAESRDLAFQNWFSTDNTIHRRRLRCPNCQSRKIRPWVNPGSCPKCENPMAIIPGHEILWD